MVKSVNEYKKVLYDRDYRSLSRYIQEDLEETDGYRKTNGYSSLIGNFTTAMKEIDIDDPKHYRQIVNDINNGYVNESFFEDGERFLITCASDSPPRICLNEIDALTYLIENGNHNTALSRLKRIKKTKGKKKADDIFDRVKSRVVSDCMGNRSKESEWMSFFNTHAYRKAGIKIKTEKGRTTISFFNFPLRIFLVSTLILLSGLLVYYEYGYSEPIQSMEIQGPSSSHTEVGTIMSVSCDIQPYKADTKDVTWSFSPRDDIEIIYEEPGMVKFAIRERFTGETLIVRCDSEKYRMHDELEIKVSNNLYLELESPLGTVSPGEAFSITAYLPVTDIGLDVEWEFDKKIMSGTGNHVLDAEILWNVDRMMIPVKATIKGTVISDTVEIYVSELPYAKGRCDSISINAGGSELLYVDVSPSGFDYSKVIWSGFPDWIAPSSITGQSIRISVSPFAESRSYATITATVDTIGVTIPFNITVEKDLGAKLEAIGSNINDLGPASVFMLHFSTESKDVDLSSLRFEVAEKSIASITYSGCDATVTVKNLVEKGSYIHVKVFLMKTLVLTKEYKLNCGTILTIIGSDGNVRAGDHISLTAVANPTITNVRVEWSSSDSRISVDSLNGSFKVPIDIMKGSSFIVTARISDTGIVAEKQFLVTQGLELTVIVPQDVNAGETYTAEVKSNPATDLSDVQWSSFGPVTIIGSSTGGSILFTVDKFAARSDEITFTVSKDLASRFTSDTIRVNTGFSIDLSVERTNISTGDTIALSVVAYPLDIDYGTPSWSIDWAGAEIEKPYGTTNTITVKSLVGSKKLFTVTVDYGGGHTKQKSITVVPVVMTLQPPVPLSNGDYFTNTVQLSLPNYDDRIRWSVVDDYCPIMLDISGKTVRGSVPLDLPGPTSFTLCASIEGTDISKTVTYNVDLRELSISVLTQGNIYQGDSVNLAVTGYEGCNEVEYVWAVVDDATFTSFSGNQATLTISNSLTEDTKVVVWANIKDTKISAKLTIDVIYDLYKGWIKLYTYSNIKETIEADMSANYVLMEDMTLTEPIGMSYGTYQAFTGTFEGNGRTIAFTYSGVPSVEGSNASVGVFAQINGGTVQNLNVSADIMAQKPWSSHYNMNTGGICGLLVTGSIIDCTVNGTISTSGEYSDGVDIRSYTGGISGQACGKCSIDGCTNSAQIHSFGSWSHAGGILGGVNGNACSISYCKNYGDVYSQGSTHWFDTKSYRGDAGGIVGAVIGGKANVSHSVSVSTMIKSGGRYMDSGGIIGRCGGTYMISYCEYLNDSLYENNSRQGNVLIDGGRETGSYVNSGGESSIVDALTKSGNMVLAWNDPLL